MTASILKNKITKAVEGINDEIFLKALYTIVSEHARKSENDFFLDEEEWAIVEERRKAYHAGDAKTVSLSEVKARLKSKFS